MTRILIIDDEDLFREDLATLLSQAGHECRTAPSGEIGLRTASQFRPDIVLCDLVMPGMSGIEVTDKLSKEHPECAVLVVSAHATVDTAVGAFRRGAFDVISKPVSTEALLNRIRRIEEQQRLQVTVKTLRFELASFRGEQELIGSSRAMREVRSLIEQVAVHDTPVLITGESGTGKEIVARMIHGASGRTGPFVAVNCMAVAENLFESGLFGHSKGAFTGADKIQRGFFESAGGGTLLLDEVGEIPLPLQGKLLRAVERREITRVGEVASIPVDVRILAATNRDLHQMVAKERFRTDLYYRLRVLQIEIPPLRKRPEDITELARHFLEQLGQKMPVSRKRLGDAALNTLLHHQWPGNGRELRNVIEHALIVGKGAVVEPTDFPRDVVGGSDTVDEAISENLREAMHQAERTHILHVLRRTGGNKTEAAKALGINPSTLWRKLEESSKA
jgi:DNA-binding NtrC family response regulator